MNNLFSMFRQLLQLFSRAKSRQTAKETHGEDSLHA